MESLSHRRAFLRQTACLAGVGWMTALGEMLARAQEANPRAPARSLIMLWLAGGPSQLETFDPHAGQAIAGDTLAIDTAVRGIQLASGLPRLAEEMQSVSLVRSLVSREGDHERGTYLVKTGHRPDPTAVHPSIGAICCHELQAGITEIPRHISILSSQWPARGGFLGDNYDAFLTGDPRNPVPDVSSTVTPERDQARTRDLDIVERTFARGRQQRVEATLHQSTLAQARRLMSSEQLRAFEIQRESARLISDYGDTPFGRGCLAARRLIEVGVRCVEITLQGWDTHADNHNLQNRQIDILDPAFATLIRDLRERGLLEHTLVLCAGEFGRTPRINRLGGRDHWTNGFSFALAGGGIRGGHVLGSTDPEGTRDPVHPVTIGDIHATLLQSLGLDHSKILNTPIGRTVRMAEGEPIGELIG